MKYTVKPTSSATLIHLAGLREVHFEAKELRGAIASIYPHELLLHQHSSIGEVLYSYPLVQYKVLDRKCIIVAIGSGAKVIKSLNLVGKSLRLSGKEVQIIGKEMLFDQAPFGMSDDYFSYSLLTPWLALNQKNYEKYQMLGSWPKRKTMLEGILVGNLISMSKSLGYTVPGPITVVIHKMEEVKTSLKGTPMLGFLGTFSVNFEIPDYWGIGKSVSRGFGTVKRVEESKS